MPLGRGALGLRPGAVPEENGSRKRRGDGLSDGDWVCPKCGNTNFAFRTVCNMRKCSTPKPSEHPNKTSSGATKNSSKAAPEGSWTCEKCGNVNYPFRTKCNRANCGAEKPSDKNDSSKSDDQKSRFDDISCGRKENG
uniref:TSA: Wollemia nobilis Ref_Wollemi_Transcript_12326_655 transcribed RNA sequence n=1 Tax=Wollemia nobilis TaxID=56998 RepID=A0A0C9S5Y9_9CONI